MDNVQNLPYRGWMPCASDAASGEAGTLRLIDPRHPRRESLEDFIRHRFMRAYGASPERLAESLYAEEDEDGQWVAAVGVRAASGERLYLEQYLDRDIEREIDIRLGRRLSRAEIVEVGNFAAVRTGHARHLISRLPLLLYCLGYRWVSFIATRGLVNSFRRLGLEPIELASADPLRLPDGGQRWGSYYRHAPMVMVGEIRHGLNLPVRP